jgi:hypothetical protein
MAVLALQERNDLPPLRFRQVSKRRHAAGKIAVPQNPKQSSGRGSVHFWLIKRRHTFATLTIPAVTGGALASIQPGSGLSGLVVAFERIPFFRRAYRGAAYQAPAYTGTSDVHTNKKTDTS